MDVIAARIMLEELRKDLQNVVVTEKTPNQMAHFLQNRAMDVVRIMAYLEEEGAE